MARRRGWGRVARRLEQLGEAFFGEIVARVGFERVIEALDFLVRVGGHFTQPIESSGAQAAFERRVFERVTQQTFALGGVARLDRLNALLHGLEDRHAAPPENETPIF